MPIYFYRRQCRFPECEKFFPLGIRNQYCEEHFLVVAIENKIRSNLKKRKINDKINKMNSEIYKKIYEKAFNKVMKEEKEKDEK